VRRFLGVLSVVMMVAGCDDSPTGGQPVTITGQVALYDELGQQLPSANQVVVAALSSSSIQQYQTSTNASGWFQLELPSGENVPLMFSRDGFGDMFRYDVEEDQEPIQVGLFARSSAAPVEVIPVAESCGTVNCLRLALDVDDFFAQGITRRLFRLYLSTDPALESWDYQFTDLLIVPNDQPGLIQTGTDATFELDGLHGFLDSFSAGTTVHLLVYGATENLESSYPEPDSGRPIFTDLSVASARASFIIP